MKTIETTCLNVKFPVTGRPETFGELLELASKAGLTEEQLLDKVCGWCLAHVVADEGRDIIREVGPDALGVPFKTKIVKLKDGTENEEDDETIGVWAKRAAAEKGTDLVGLGALLQPFVMDAKDDKGEPLGVLEFSVGGARKRGTGTSGKLGKEVLAQAKAAIDAGRGEDVVSALVARHPDLTFVRDDKGVVTVDSLASAIRENKLRREREDAKLLGLAA